MSIYLKIGIVLVLFIVIIVVTMFPGWWPIRIFEPVFYSTCRNVMKGELNKVEETKFVGFGGLPVRNDYLECGVDPAGDAHRICYIVPTSGSVFDENPLGAEKDNDCDQCQYGSEKVKYKGKVLGEQCRPYRQIWRWVYEMNY